MLCGQLGFPGRALPAQPSCCLAQVLSFTPHQAKPTACLTPANSTSRATAPCPHLQLIEKLKAEGEVQQSRMEALIQMTKAEASARDAAVGEAAAAARDTPPQRVAGPLQVGGRGRGGPPACAGCWDVGKLGNGQAAAAAKCNELAGRPAPPPRCSAPSRERVQALEPSFAPPPPR